MRHRFHALCPYFAMFPESFAEKWIGRLTRPGDIVLDPFCGRGTAPFQALLMGREAVGGDVNPVAYCVTRAKTNAPAASAVRHRLTVLEKEFPESDWEVPRRRLPTFFYFAYRPKSLRQLLYLRERLRWRQSHVDCTIAALVLGALHGESEKSPAFLSNQMPHTISTKPAYSIRFWRRRGLTAPERDAFLLLRNAVTYRYQSEPPTLRARVLQADVRELPRLREGLPGPIRCVVTSPPYFNVTCYEEDQWLRLWFLGGPPQPTYHKLSRDDRHEDREKYWSFIGDFWRSLGTVLASKAHVVVRLGGKGLGPREIVKTLAACSMMSRRRVRLVQEEVSEIKRRQTDAFRPGSTGCLLEVDCVFEMA